MSDLLRALQAGEAVIVATDTVYGVAALPGSAGVERIFELKRRPAGQALPWLVSGPASLERYGESVLDYALRLADMFWPGALTLVVRASSEAERLGELAADGTVALRCPDNAALLDMLEALDGPIACTSANLHGHPAATTRAGIPQPMRALPGFEALDDLSGSQAASTIVDCTGAYPIILREGPIPEQVVLDVAVFGAKLTDFNDRAHA